MAAYECSHSIPSVETYVHLRTSTGLTPKTPAAAAVGLSNTLFAVQVASASTPGTFVGMGRIIGDGGCFFQIVDVCVDPAHQGRGVGKMVMKELKEWLDKNVPKSGVVLLFADGKANELYKQFGFIETTTLPIPSVGMACIY